MLTELDDVVAFEVARAGPLVEDVVVTTGVPAIGPIVVIPVEDGGVKEVTFVLDETVCIVEGIARTVVLGPTVVVVTSPVVVLEEIS